MKSPIMLSNAIEGYLLYADARRLSPETIRDYTFTLGRFQAFLQDDLPVESITSKHVQAFLASLVHLSKKTLLNYHIGLSAFWTWAVKEGIAGQHIQVPAGINRPPHSWLSSRHRCG
jgi:site-specific recombinase XerD